MWTLLIYVACAACPALGVNFVPMIAGKPGPEDNCYWREPCLDLARCQSYQPPYEHLYFCHCYQRFYRQQRNCHCGNLGDTCVQDFCAAPPATPCRNGGTCVSQWGDHACLCAPGFMGVDCEEEAPPGLLRYGPPLQIIFNTDAYTGVPADFYVVALADGLGSGFSAHVGFGDDGPGGTVTADAMRRHRDFRLPLRNKYIHKVMPPGPHLVAKFSHTYYLKDEVVKVTLTVRNQGHLQFDQELPLYVNPSPRLCTPDVEIVDCGQTKEFVGHQRRFQKKRPRWFRTDKYVLRSRVVPDCWGLSSKLSYRWVLCREVGAGKEECTETRSSGKDMHYTVRPFRLAYGVYETTLIAEETVEDETYLRSFSQRAFCSFEMTPWPMTAVIDGGYSVSVPPGQPLEVVGRNSYDPNFPGRKDHLSYDWKCSVAEDRFLDLCQRVQTKGPHLHLPAKHVVAGLVITFTLVVTDGLAPSAPVKQTVSVGKTRSPNLKVICHSNCAYNELLDPERTVALRVECVDFCQGEHEEGFYRWSVLELSEATWLPRLFFPRSSRFFYLTPGALTADGYHVVTVEGGAQEKSVRTVGLHVGRHPSDGHCDVKPSGGVAGVTRFVLGCHNFDNYEPSDVVYEFYQFDVAVESDAGVLLEYGYNPTVSTYLLPGVASKDYDTRLHMRVVAGSGLMRTFDVALKVTAPPYMLVVASARCDSLLSPNKYAFHDTSELVRQLLLVSEVGHLLHRSLLSHRETCAMEMLASVPLSSVSAVAQVAMALRRLLLYPAFCSARVRALAAERVHALIAELAGEVGERRFDGYVLYHARHAADAILGCVGAIMDHVVVPCQGSAEDYSMDYPVYSDLTYDCVQTKLSNQLSMRYLLSTVTIWGKMMDKIQLVSDDHANFTAPTGVMHACFQRYLPKDVPPTSDCAGDGHAVAEMSAAMRRHLREGGPLPVGLTVAVVRHRPFWWHQSGLAVSTSVLLLECPTLGLMTLRNPVDMHLAVTQHIGEGARPLTGVVKASHGWSDSSAVDLWLPLHLVVADEGDVVVVSFVELPEDAPITAVVTVGRRPTLHDFEATGKVFSKDYEGPKNLVSPDVADEDGTLVYVGLVPAEGRLRRDANYSMFVYLVRCQYWMSELQSWFTEGCHVANETDGKVLHCRCHHMSVFSGRSVLVPEKRDVLMNVKVTVTQSVYPYALTAILLLLLLLLLLFLLALLMDGREHAKEIIFLSDNIPGYSYVYLIGVFTGDRKGATTTSRVGFQVIGNQYKSRHHLLLGPGSGPLRRNTDTWFVLLTRLDLGELRTLRLWHDSSGEAPSWFCSRLFFVDIQRDRRWTFVVDDWLSAEKGAHLLVPAAPASDAYGRRHPSWSLHPWVGVFGSYPRVHKVGVLAAMVLVHMLVCMLAMYGWPDQGPAASIVRSVGPPSPSHLLAAAVTALVGFVVTLLITLLFMKTRRRWQPGVTLRGAKGWATPYDEALAEDAGSPRPFASRSVPERMETSGGQLLQSYGRAPALFQEHFTYLEYPELETPLALRRERTFEVGRPLGDTGAYWFPPSFIYVAWVVCALVVLVATALLLLLCLSYGRDASLAWGLTTLLALGLTGLVLFPLALLLVALCGAARPRYDFAGGRGRLTVVTDSYYPREEPALVAYLLKLNLLRKTPPYRPPVSWGRRGAGWRSRRRPVLEALLLLLLLATLFLLAAAFRDALQQSKGRVLGAALRRSALGADDVRTAEDAEALLRYTALPLLYAKQADAGTPLPRAGFTQDPLTFLVGATRLRQKRLAPDACRFPKALYDATRRCDAEYDAALEEARNLSVGWASGAPVAEDSPRLTEPWRHRASTGSWPRQGDVALYGDGGYVASLGRTAVNALLTLSYLSQLGWTDARWRALFWDYVTLAPDRNLVGADALLAERSATGLVRVGVYGCSLWLPPDHDAWTVVATVAALVLVALVAVALCLHCREARHEGRRCCRRPWVLVDVALTVLGVATVVSYFLSVEARHRAVKCLRATERHEYVNFEDACRSATLLSVFLALLTATALLRVWGVLGRWRPFAVAEAAARGWAAPVLATALFALGVAAALALAWHVRMAAASWHFRTAWHSLLCVVGAALGFARRPLPPPPAYGFLGAALRLSLLAALVAILLQHYRDVSYAFRRRRPRGCSARRSPDALRGGRLRGGADAVSARPPAAVLPRDSRRLRDAERRLLVAKRRLMAALTARRHDDRRQRLAALAVNAASAPPPRAARTELFYRGFGRDRVATLVPAPRLDDARRLVEAELRAAPTKAWRAEAFAGAVPWENEFGWGPPPPPLELIKEAESVPSSTSTVPTCHCGPEPEVGVVCECVGEGGGGGGGGLRILVAPSVDDAPDYSAVRIRVLRDGDGDVKLRIQWL